MNVPVRDWKFATLSNALLTASGGVANPTTQIHPVGHSALNVRFKIVAHDALQQVEFLANGHPIGSLNEKDVLVIYTITRPPGIHRGSWSYILRHLIVNCTGKRMVVQRGRFHVADSIDDGDQIELHNNIEIPSS